MYRVLCENIARLLIIFRESPFISTGNYINNSIIIVMVMMKPPADMPGLGYLEAHPRISACSLTGGSTPHKTPSDHTPNLI
jgi:hypothetical protein